MCTYIKYTAVKTRRTGYSRRDRAGFEVNNAAVAASTADGGVAGEGRKHIATNTVASERADGDSGGTAAVYIL